MFFTLLRVPPKVYINLIFQRAQQERKIYSVCTICTMSLYVASVFEILWTSKNFSGSVDFVKQNRGLRYPATTLVQDGKEEDMGSHTYLSADSLRPPRAMLLAGVKRWMGFLQEPEYYHQPIVFLS